MKMLKALVISCSLVGFLVTGCGKKESGDLGQDGNFKIGISQMAEHPALDGAREGFLEGLKEEGLNVEIDYQNAQGDVSNTVTIAQKFVKDDRDLIFAIGTAAAQSAKQASSTSPILFSAVTDPVETGLVASNQSPDGNITGTSDMGPIENQLGLFKEIDPSIKKIGILFNTGEPNSKVLIERSKEIAKTLELEIVEKGINNINDIPQATDSLLKDVDGIYTITDNMVASAINVVADKATKAGILTIGGEEAHVAGGIALTDGISYFELGKQTAKMAKEILVDKKPIKEIPVEVSIRTQKVFNEKTIDQLSKLDFSKVLKDGIKIND